MRECAQLINEVARECRAPLTVLSGYLETMLGQDSEWASALRTMQLQSQRIERVLDDLAYLLALETTANPEGKTVNVAAIIHALYDELRVYYPNKRYEFYCDCACDILGSADELYIAFSNLLNNASEFSPADATVRTACLSENGRLQMDIVNSDAFVAEDHLAKLMQRFYRVDPNSEGSGLGLPIAHQVIIRHHGTLSLKNAKDGCFTARCEFNLASQL